MDDKASDQAGKPVASPIAEVGDDFLHQRDDGHRTQGGAHGSEGHGAALEHGAKPHIDGNAGQQPKTLVKRNKLVYNSPVNR